MKKVKRTVNYFDLNSLDLTGYEEVTGNELFLINGGRQMKSDRTNDSEYVPSRPSSSSESGNSSGTSTTSNSVPAATQTTTSSSQTYSSSQPNNTEAKTSSTPTCTAAQIAAAKGAAANAYFAEQDKKRQENKKEQKNTGTGSTSNSSNSSNNNNLYSTHSEEKLAKIDERDTTGNNSKSEIFAGGYDNNAPAMGQNLPEDTMEKIYKGENPLKGRKKPLNPAEQNEMARQQENLHKNGVSCTPLQVTGLSVEGKEFIAVKIEGGFHSEIYDAKDKNHKYQRGDTQKTGDWTIGYGHKLTAYELEQGIYDNGIDETKGNEIFLEDSKKFENVVKEKVMKTYELTQYQFDALVSVAYNLGEDGFDNSEFKKVFLKYKNQNFSYIVSTEDFKKDMSDAFRFHIPVAGDPTNAGIKKRRYNEAQLFMYGDYVYDETPQYLLPWRAGTIVERREQ